MPGKFGFPGYPPLLTGGYYLHRGVKKLEIQPKTPLSDFKENVILIDWLTVTIHDTDVREVQLMLGLDPEEFKWSEDKVFCNGYPMQSTYKNIIIRWGADRAEFYTSDDKKSADQKVRHDMGICLNMSGQGCRTYEQYGHGDWYFLLCSLCNGDRKINFTRLDLAYDDHTGVLDMVRMRSDLEDRNFVTRSKHTQLIWSDDINEDIQGLTLEVGSRKSPVLIRIYNKAAERGFDHSLHWIRVELQLRAERALVAVAKIIEHDDVGKVFSGVLRNYFTFREPTEDTNSSRWPITTYWAELIGDMEKISLWISPGEPYNFSKTEYHMIEQYGQALLCYYACHHSFTSLISAAQQRHPVLDKKYESVIAEADRQREQRRNLYEESRKKSNKVRAYYGFEPIPEDDPSYQDIFDVFIDELLPGSDAGS